MNFLFRSKFKSRSGKIILWGHNNLFSLVGHGMTIPFILKRKLLDKGGSVNEDHSSDKQELVLVVIMVTSLCISRFFPNILPASMEQLFEKPLKAWWKSTVGTDTFLFSTFQRRYFRNHQNPTFKNYERIWQLSIHCRYIEEHVGVVSVKAAIHEKKWHLGYLALEDIYNVHGKNVTCICMRVHMNVCV